MTDTIDSLTTLEDGAYRLAKIGLRVMRGDGDPDKLPVEPYSRLRRGVDRLDGDVLGRFEAAVLSVPEDELLDLLEARLEDGGAKLDQTAAAGDLSLRPECTSIMEQYTHVSTGEKFAITCIALGVAYMRVENYMEGVMAWWAREQCEGGHQAGGTLV